jgi:hypothetical protein
MENVGFNSDTLEILRAMLLPGETFDALARRLAGVPPRQSRRTPAKPKPPKGKPGAPLGRWKYVYEGIRALGLGQEVRFRYLGERDPFTGAFGNQSALMQAVNRVIANWQAECPELELSFAKQDYRDWYIVHRRDPSKRKALYPQPWKPAP